MKHFLKVVLVVLLGTLNGWLIHGLFEFHTVYGTVCSNTEYDNGSVICIKYEDDAVDKFDNYTKWYIKREEATIKATNDIAVEGARVKITTNRFGDIIDIKDLTPSPEPTQE